MCLKNMDITNIASAVQVKNTQHQEGVGIKTCTGKQWCQSTKSLESGLLEEESNVAAANIVTDVPNITVIILVAIIVIDGYIKDAQRSQMKINILSVICVNLRKVELIDVIIKQACIFQHCHNRLKDEAVCDTVTMSQTDNSRYVSKYKVIADVVCMVF